MTGSRAAHPVARYLPLLIEGDERGLRDLFGGDPRVNDPHLGWVDAALFDRFVENSSLGLTERQATVEHVMTTATAGGATEECILRLVRYGVAILLPVAIASDMSADAIDSIRIYHSMRPLLGFHLLRAPMLPVGPALVLPDVVGRYHECLARGDVAGIVQLFAPTGGLREAGGVVPIHQGEAALRRFFDSLFANGGGLGLDYCAFADEGASCTLEYVVSTWGRSNLPSQAAAAVYERADTGLLAEVRMYDDVEHPLRFN
ncbi:MAG TPA: nuclear transport factor 2 family protein [Vicinamibacteria bacterium]|nr:nuclear transport factor 2 family protein [Vicinamibacteria bacterium]